MGKTIAPEIRVAIDQAFKFLPPQLDSPKARVMVYATGWQESRFEFRRQVVEVVKRGRVELSPTGPAKGFWQFERGGGCKGVLQHPSSRYWMVTACQHHGVAPNPSGLWDAIQDNDVLAAIAARLLYFTDPKKLPEVSDVEGAWKLYLRTWRPGAAKRQYDELREKWTGNHDAAASIGS